MLERKITEYLKKWKDNPNRIPLVIKGLRQVGKTYTVKQFAKENYENAFILDFRKQTSLSNMFEGDFNIDDIALSITALPKENQLIENSKMIPNKTILIFDELQDCPNARSSLKYFKEDGRYDVICTGSLLGIEGYRIGKKLSRGIAVGFEEQIEMYPLDFEEFLWALKVDKAIIQSLKDCIDNKKAFPLFLHEKFMDLIRKYICVGGMPEAVNTFIETNDIKDVRKIQARLIKDYKTDFGSHLNDNNEIVVDELEKAKILDVFDSIPKQLAKENKKFQYAAIKKNAKGRTYEGAIKWLKNYGLIDICYNLSTIDEPLDFFSIKDQFKVYVSDIGLLTAMLDDTVPSRILSNDLGMGKGMIYENLVADSFHKLGKKMYYFAKESGLEIDFVTILFGKTHLVEAKAKSGKTKASKNVLADPKYKVNDLLKLTAQNIGYVDNKFTCPYYSGFYILGK